MKGITVPKTEKFLKVDGTPFMVAKKDSKGEPVYKLNDKGDILYDLRPGIEKPFAVPIAEREVVGWLLVLKEVMENLQDAILREQAEKKAEKKEAPGLSWEDTVLGCGVFRAINIVCDGQLLELEDAEYTWLHDKFKKYIPAIYGFNAFIIGEPLEHPEDLGKERAERRREEKQLPSKVVELPCKT